MLASAKAAFAQAGPELVAACIEAYRTHAQPPYGRPAVASGETGRRIREEHTEEELRILGPPHFQTLLTGRGPTRGSGEGTGEPLHTILEQWAQDKGIILTGGMSYRQFGFAAAKRIHDSGTALFRLRQPSGLLDKVLTRQFLDTLKARIAAGEMVAFASELRSVLAL